MVEGKISFEGTTYQAATKLRKDDVRLIAKLAAEKNMLTSGEIRFYFFVCWRSIAFLLLM